MKSLIDCNEIRITLLPTTQTDSSLDLENFTREETEKLIEGEKSLDLEGTLKTTNAFEILKPEKDQYHQQACLQLKMQSKTDLILPLFLAILGKLIHWFMQNDQMNKQIAVQSVFIIRSAETNNLIVILVGLIYLTRATCFMDYTQEKMEQCHFDSSKQVIPNIDLFLIILISPFSLCAALIVIWTFLKFSESRKQPSDMVFSVSACDAVLNIHWLMSSIYQITQDPYSAPDKHSFFCEFNAVLSITAGSLEYLYNILFCVFLITRIRNSLEGSRIRKSGVHGFCWVGALGFYAFFKIQGKTGVNSYGMCSYEADSDTYIAGIGLFAIYWLLSGFTLGFFKKYVPDSEAFKEQKQDFIRFYFGYSIITNISWLLIAVSNTITSLNCKYQWGPFLGIFITIGNATKVITPIFSAIVRFKDPTLQQCMRNYKIMQKEKEIEMSFFSSQKGKSSFFESFVLRNSSIVHRSFEGSKAQDDIRTENHVSWSNSLSQNLKLLRIVSIFAGLSAQDELRKTPPQIVKKHANIRFYDNSMIKDNDLESFPEGDIHHMRMKAYFEDEFVELRERDDIPINMKTVFSIPSNLEALKKITSLIGDGGRSGQMVLSNFDGKIIIKTVSSADVSSFIKISDKYFNYMKTNHDSTLIVLIYGLYTFKRVDAQDSKTHLLIMKNITASIPKSLVLRKYDLKGSRYDRAVLSKHKLSAAEFIGISQHSSSHPSEGKEEIGVIPQWVLNYNDKRNSFKVKEHDFLARNNLRNVSNRLNKVFTGKSDGKKEYVKLNQITMKDADFEKLEKKVIISEEHSKIIKTTLQKDCVFLRNCGLIDYSLLICKVAGLNGICSNSSSVANSSSSKGVSCAYPSTQEPQVYYYIGIIDYLQEWNIDKLIEQKAKKTLNVNPNLNVSSQNPTTYCSRFILNVIDAFF